MANRAPLWNNGGQLTTLGSGDALYAPGGATIVSAAAIGNAVGATATLSFQSSAWSMVYDDAAGVGQMTFNAGNKGTIHAAPAATAGKFELSAPALVNNALNWSTDGSLRYQMRRNAGAEGLGNSGSGFEFEAFDNSGASLGNIFSVVRATRAVFFNVLPTVGTAAAGNNTTSAASTAYAMAAAPNASYRTLLDSSASHTAARAAGTYWLGQGHPAGVTGVGTLDPANVIYIDPADYPTVNGLTTQLRIRAIVEANDVAPGGAFTFGLYPVTRPATSGGAGVVIYTMGTVIAGSTVAVTPAADSQNNLVGSDFSIPAAGFYVIGFVAAAAVATSAHVHISASLQLRNA